MTSHYIPTSVALGRLEAQARPPYLCCGSAFLLCSLLFSTPVWAPVTDDPAVCLLQGVFGLHFHFPFFQLPGVCYTSGVACL